MQDNVTSPTPQDRAWLVRAREHVLSLLSDDYDEGLSGSEKDLELAQELLVDGIVALDDRLGLLSLGALLGDVFDATTSMKWSRVENEYGSRLSLHSEVIHFTLYPLEMITQRADDGREIDIPALYRSFKHDLGL
jgi:hypothetical protein